MLYSKYIKSLLTLVTVLSIALCSVILCPNVAFAQDVSPENPDSELSEDNSDESDNTDVITAFQDDIISHDIAPQAVQPAASCGISPTGDGLQNVAISLGNGVPLSTVDGGSKEETYAVTDVQIGSNLYESSDSNVGEIEVKGRGNSSWGHPKKSYQIKFKKKQSVDSMGNAKKWVLLANWADSLSGIRNDLSRKLAKDIDMPYVADLEYVNLYVNCEFRGLYQLGEKNEAGKASDSHGVALADDNGVLVELNDHGSDLDFTAGAYSFGLTDSKANDVGEPDSKAQVGAEQFRQSWTGFINALAAGNWADVQNYIDVDSFAKHVILSNFIGQVDAFSGSTYFYKDGASDKIHMGPIWDNDASANNYPERHGSSLVTSTQNSQDRSYRAGMSNYIVDLSRFSEFQALVNGVKSTYKPKFLSIIDYVYSQYNTLSQNIANDKQMWPADGRGTTKLPVLGDNVRQLTGFLGARVCGLGIDSTKCPNQDTPVYRLVSNSNYLYTTNWDEAVSASNGGYRYEGVGFYAYSSNSYACFNPIYRTVTSDGKRVYTASAEDTQNITRAGGRYEGIGWCGTETEPLYRFVTQTGSYFYTTSVIEGINASAFMRFDKIDGNANIIDYSQGNALYRFAHLSNEGYFYTSSITEAMQTLQYGYRFEGEQGRVGKPSHNIPVYRCAKYQGGYFYTTSYDEYQTCPVYAMRQEGVAYYTASEGTWGSSRFYRSAKLNGAGYFYTTDYNEYLSTVNFNMRPEGNSFLIN